MSWIIGRSRRPFMTTSPQCTYRPYCLRIGIRGNDMPMRKSRIRTGEAGLETLVYIATLSDGSHPERLGDVQRQDAAALRRWLTELGQQNCRDGRPNYDRLSAELNRETEGLKVTYGHRLVGRPPRLVKTQEA